MVDFFKCYGIFFCYILSYICYNIFIFKALQHLYILIFTNYKELLLNMLLRKDFFLFNVVISCLILFFPIYEIFLPKKIINFIFFDIYNIINFCLYCFILYFNINLIYFYMDSSSIAFLENSLKKVRQLKEKNNIIDLLFFFYFFRLKFNEFLFIIKNLFKNKISCYYLIFVLYNVSITFNIYFWRPLFRRISYFGMYSAFLFKKNKNMYNNF